MQLDSSTIQTGSATYCPEDNKLRLYVGRVPRSEYDALRAEGWTATPKQNCQFVAHWTPERRDTALAYGGGIIEDEDQSPAERAADRAERFAGYREKRADEATARADRYDAGPQAHGYQSQERAERAAARHDRIADRACDAWSKAEYWQRRTAGVISHALHVCSPSVRMGRIKELEADLRRFQAVEARHTSRETMHPRDLAWLTHFELRMAYENQMLEAQGGRAGVIEIEVGGTWLGRVIAKVNKSNVTGRVVSVGVIGPSVSDWTYKAENVTGTAFALYQFGVERAKPESYAAPTEESRAALAAFEAAKKAASAKRKGTEAPCPLINPTDADAERLQAIWNEHSKHERARWGENEAPTVARMTQAQYSAASKGSYAPVETAEITGGGFQKKGRGMMDAPDCPSVAKVRRWRDRVVILTDKPQKAFAPEVWHDPRPEIVAELAKQLPELRRALGSQWLHDMTPEGRALVEKARIVGIAYVSSLSQFGFTPSGSAWAAQVESVATVGA